MLILHLFVAFLIALPLWYLGSWLLAQAIYRTETRNPKFAETAVWTAIETVSNIILFLFAIRIWLGVTYARQRLTP